MRIKRTLPPSAAPIKAGSIIRAMTSCLRGRNVCFEIEDELREHFQASEVFLVSSGKAGLLLLLEAMKKLRPRKKSVVVPAYTCYSVPSAVKKAGLKVVPCDIEAGSFDFDFEELNRRSGDDLLAVISTSLFSMPSDIKKTREFASRCNAFVIDDAAQAFGMTDKSGAVVGMRGDAGIFSFSRGKTISSGSGGAIVTNNNEIAKTVRVEFKKLGKPGLVANIKDLMCNSALYVFLRPGLYWLPDGLPFTGLGKNVFSTEFKVGKMSDMNASMLFGWKERLERSNAVRTRNSRFFREQLRLDLPKDELPYLRMPVLMQNNAEREKSIQASQEKGLGLSSMYPAPISSIPEVKADTGDVRFPKADNVAGRLLTLPTHEYVREKDMEKICELLTATERLKQQKG